MKILSFSVEMTSCTQEATIIVQDNNKNIYLTGTTIKCKAKFEFGENSKYALKINQPYTVLATSQTQSSTLTAFTYTENMTVKIDMNNKGVDAGMIAGIVIGGVALIVIIACIAVYIAKKPKKDPREDLDVPLLAE